MKRITEKDLQAVVTRINAITGSPPEPYIGFDPQANCYHLYFAYGAVALHRMSAKPGCTGVSQVIGLNTKRELYNAMHAYIAGLAEGAK